MTNYIVNKTTTEIFAIVEDSMIAATKAVEQGNGVAVNVSVAYNARPQIPTPSSVAPTHSVAGPTPTPQLRPVPLPTKVASKKS